MFFHLDILTMKKPFCFFGFSHSLFTIHIGFDCAELLIPHSVELIDHLHLWPDCISWPCSSLNSLWPWIWKQYILPKCWYPCTTLHGVTAQKTSIWTVYAMKTWNLKSLFTLFWTPSKDSFLFIISFALYSSVLVLVHLLVNLCRFRVSVFSSSPFTSLHAHTHTHTVLYTYCSPGMCDVIIKWLTQVIIDYILMKCWSFSLYLENVCVVAIISDNHCSHSVRLVKIMDYSNLNVSVVIMNLG